MPSQSALRSLALRKSDSALQQALAVDVVLALAGGEIVDEGRVGHAALPVGRRHVELLLDAEADDAGELEEVAAVAGLGELGDAADAADLVEIGLVFGPGCAASGWIMPIRRWPERSASSIIAMIARLENVERHLSARQQQRARQRKHRDHVGEVAGTVDRPRSSASSLSHRGNAAEAGRSVLVRGRTASSVRSR